MSPPNIADIHHREMIDHPEELETKWRLFAVQIHQQNPKKILLSEVHRLVYKLNYLAARVMGVNIPESYLQDISTRLINAEPGCQPEVEVMMENLRFHLRSNLQFMASSVSYFYEETRDMLFYDETAAIPHSKLHKVTVHYQVPDTGGNKWRDVSSFVGELTKMAKSDAGMKMVKYYERLNNHDLKQRQYIENGDFSSLEMFHIKDLMRKEIMNKALVVQFGDDCRDIEITKEDYLYKEFDQYVFFKRVASADLIPHLNKEKA